MQDSKAHISTDFAPDVLNIDKSRKLDAKVENLLNEHDVKTAGLGIVQGGQLVWDLYYGQQSPNQKANKSTLFNVASITKVVFAETIFALIEQGKLSLDEPLSSHWIDPDIASDPDHYKLTPRMVLSHTTGFPNWRFMLPDRKLSFIHAPGKQFSYSGEGFEYLVNFVEKKLGQTMEDVTKKYIINPWQLGNTSLSVQPKNFPFIAHSTSVNGKFAGYYCRPNGWCRKSNDYSAADDMVITVPDAARFLVKAAEGKHLSPTLRHERLQIQSELGKQAVVLCNEEFVLSIGQKTIKPNSQECPQQQGYGLGWKVIEYGDRKIIGHGGSDWSELALVYIDTNSLNGIIIFLNGKPNQTLPIMPKLLSLLDENSPYINLYARWYAAYLENNSK